MQQSVSHMAWNPDGEWKILTQERQVEVFFPAQVIVGGHR